MTKWALLIGIDFYLGDEYPPLKGCVHDVERMEEYLQSGADDTKPVITKLVARAPPSGPDSTDQTTPDGEPSSWPTVNNVHSALQRITAEAKLGDEVCIYYSGHGTRHPDTSPLILVLFEKKKIPVRYFYGEFLARGLADMAKRGLVITAVLDCCSSGSVLRSDDAPGVNIRTVEYDPLVAAISLDEWPSNAFETTAEDTTRDAHTTPHAWLTDPKGYTILAACGPHEKAKESNDSGEWRGVLSYSLTTALGNLRSRGATITNDSLYGYLREDLHARSQSQTPMYYGDGVSTFFSTVASSPTTTPWVQVFVEGDQVRLDAGEAHGVHEGDLYQAFPLETTETVEYHGGQAGDSITLRVERVRGLTSDLIETDPETSGTQLRLPDAKWKARLVSAGAASRQIKVRFTEGAAHHYHASRSRDLGDVENIGEEPEWLHIQDENDTTASSFHVTVNSQDEYEILDASLQAFPNLPRISIHADDNGRDGLVRVLHHLAQFKYFEGIDNRLPDAAFESGFAIYALMADGEIIDSPGTLHVKHGEMWRLVAENKTNSPLYMTVFNMTPTWEVTIAGAKGDASTFTVLEPRKDKPLRTHRFRMTMKIPEPLLARGQTQCEEMMKVFVTSRPSQFPPRIVGEMFDSNDNDGDGGEAQAISDVLETLDDMDGLRGDTSPSRDGSWATTKFIVRTTMEKDVVEE